MALDGLEWVQGLRWMLLLGACTAAVGCSDASGHTLAVNLQTDLLVGREFDATQVVLENLDTGTTRRLTIRPDVAGFLPAARLTDVGDLQAGAYRLELLLLDESRSGALTQRPVLVEVRENTVVTVPVTRDCVNVSCPPAEDPSRNACFGGQCVDPRCSLEQPELCTAVGSCLADADCTASSTTSSSSIGSSSTDSSSTGASTCGVARCLAGACWVQANDASCAGDLAWCHPDLGCQASAAFLGTDDGVGPGSDDPPVSLSARLAPVVQYWINEADAGQDVVALQDAVAPPLDLSVHFPHASTPRFATGTGGGRHLAFSDAENFNTGGARWAWPASSKLDALGSSAGATLEIKYANADCPTSYGYRLFGFGTGNEPESKWLTMRYAEFEDSEALVASFSGRAEHDVFCPSVPCGNGTPRVLHWVVDTQQAAVSDRVRLYVNGVRDTGVHSCFWGTWPDRNQPLDLGDAATLRQVYLGGAFAPPPFSEARPSNARIYYAAAYAGVLSDAEVQSHAQQLLADDDALR